MNLQKALIILNNSKDAYVYSCGPVAQQDRATDS